MSRFWFGLAPEEHLPSP